jgi:hypothetical protein
MRVPRRPHPHLQPLRRCDLTGQRGLCRWNSLEMGQGSGAFGWVLDVTGCLCWRGVDGKTGVQTGVAGLENRIGP